MVGTGREGKRAWGEEQTESTGSVGGCVVCVRVRVDVCEGRLRGRERENDGEHREQRKLKEG